MVMHTEKPRDFEQRFSVAACYLCVGKEFLLLKRHPKKPQGGTWALPAGKLEAGESEVQAIVRELREELNLIVHENEVSALPKVFVSHSGYNFSYAMFRCEFAKRPKLRLNRAEHTEYRWCTAEEALRLNLIPDEDMCIKLCYGLP